MTKPVVMSSMWQWLILATTASILGLALSGCGGGATSRLVTDPSQNTPNAYQPVAAPSIDLAKPLKLADKVKSISTCFTYPVLPEDYQNVESTAFRSADPDLVVYYPRNLKVADVNTARASLKVKSSSVVKNPLGYEVEASTIDPDAIAPELANASPAPSQTALAPKYVENTNYLAASRFLAAKYGLTIKREMYFSARNAVVFQYGTGVDAEALALRIQNENNDFVDAVAPQLVAFPASFEPRQDTYVDHLASIGTGIAPTTNGPAYWNSLECFGLFEVNAHPVHASFFGPYSTTGVPGCGVGCSAFVLDSGARADHPDLSISQPQPAIVTIPGWNTADYPNLQNLHDGFGHGTATTGIIAARDRNNIGIAGIIPYGTVYPIKVYETTNQSTTFANMAEGIVQAFNYHLNGFDADECNSHIGPEVACLNMYGGQYPLSAMTDLRQALLTVREDPYFMLVAPAGNAGGATASAIAYDPVTHEVTNFVGYWPASLAVISNNVIGVGAVTPLSQDVNSETKSNFSNYPYSAIPALARATTIAATGGDTNAGIYSRSTSTTTYSLAIPGQTDYCAFYGTSAAAAYVTGAIALLQSYAPELEADQVRSHIEQLARRYYWNDPASAFVSPSKLYQPMPVLDLGRSMSWIEIDEPAENTHILDPITITASSYLAGGNIEDDLAGASARFYIEQNGLSNYIGEDTTRPFSIVLDPSTIPNLTVPGTARIYAILETGNAGHMPIMTLPVTVYLDSSRNFADPNPLRGKMAIGKDPASNKLHIAYVVKRGATEFIRNAIETAAGSMLFNINDYIPPVGLNATYEDLAIVTPQGGSTGFSYQLWTSGLGQACFTYYNGLTFTTITEPNSSPYLVSIANSSFRIDPNSANWYAMYTTGNSGVARAQRPTPGTWNPYTLNPDTVGKYNFRTCMDLVPGTLYEPWRTAIRSEHPGQADDYDKIQLAYGTNYINNLIQTRVNVWGGFYAPNWLGTTYKSNGSFCDQYFSPCVMLAGYNTLSEAFTTTSMVAATQATSSTWDMQNIEICGGTVPHYPTHEGNYGDSIYLPTRDEQALIFFSGVQATQQFASDRGDMKLALLTTNGWERSVISSTPASDANGAIHYDCALTSRSNVLYGVFPVVNSSGIVSLRLWCEND